VPRDVVSGAAAVLRRLRSRGRLGLLDCDPLVADILAAGAAGGQPAAEPHGPPYSLNWVVPPPSPGSGGHTNIARFQRLLGERGHTQRMFAYDVTGRMPAAEIEARFSTVGSPLPPEPLPARLPPADFQVATSWPTAWGVAARAGIGRRVYWVQDYEPWFYAEGSEHSLAAATYGLGLHGIALGKGLARHLTASTPMRCDWYGFGVEPGRFRFDPVERPPAVCFYARPETPRRGWELGMLALAEVARREPAVQLHAYGAPLPDRGLPASVTSHGVLPPSGLAELYNRCRAALVLSFTNPSLTPLEAVASGATCVTNDSPLNRVALAADGVTFAPPTPGGLADAVCAAVDAWSPAAAGHCAAAVGERSWEAGAGQVEAVLNRLAATA
jgi:glycosyltransferase involved in cell wall biosynthesis